MPFFLGDGSNMHNKTLLHEGSVLHESNEKCYNKKIKKCVYKKQSPTKG